MPTDFFWEKTITHVPKCSIGLNCITQKRKILTVKYQTETQIKFFFSLLILDAQNFLKRVHTYAQLDRNLLICVYGQDFKTTFTAHGKYKRLPFRNYLIRSIAGLIRELSSR